MSCWRRSSAALTPFWSQLWSSSANEGATLTHSLVAGARGQSHCPRMVQAHAGQLLYLLTAPCRGTLVSLAAASLRCGQLQSRRAHRVSKTSPPQRPFS
jgi:hypothetical protein